MAELRDIGIVFLFLAVALGIILFLLANPRLEPMNISASFSCPSTIVVVVSNSTGRVQGASVSLYLGDSQLSSATTNQDGEASLSVTRDGTYTLKAEKQGHSEATATISAFPSSCPGGGSQSQTQGTSGGSQTTTQQQRSPNAGIFEPLLRLTAAIFMFYVVLFFLSKIFSSERLMNVAKEGAVDVVFTFIIAVLFLNIASNDAINNSLVYFVELITGQSSQEGATIHDWYGQLSSEAIKLMSGVMENTARALLDIGLYSGSLSFTLAGGTSGDPILSTIGIFGTGPKPSGVIGEAGQAASSFASGAVPSTSTSFGVGGPNIAFYGILSVIWANTSMIFSLLTSITTLVNMFSSPEMIQAMVLLGVFLRGLGFSKGGGSFLIAFALTTYLILPTAVVFGLVVLNNYLSSHSITIDSSSLQNLVDKNWNAPGASIGVNVPATFSDSEVQRIFSIFSSSQGLKNLPFLIVSYSLILGFSLLLVVSASGGLSKLMGAEVSIWIIGQLTRLV